MSIQNTTTKQEFDEEVLKSDKLVLVDFWAEWCMPCRAMSPILDMLSRKMSDTVQIVKVNIEETSDNGQLAQEYGVSGIPNMKIFKDGEMVKEIVGMRPLVALEAELQSFLDK